MSLRQDRLSSVILRGAQSVISEGFNDPRLDGCLITVTQVKLDRDVTTAVLRVSVMPERAERRALAGLQAAARHIRRQTADRVSVHRMPRFEFRIDRSAKRQLGVLEALAQARGASGVTGDGPADGPADDTAGGIGQERADERADALGAQDEETGDLSVAETTKSITSFVKRLPKGDCEPPPDGRTAVEELVYSFLLWESTTSRADNAFKRVGEQFVDLNDLRVSRHAEVAAVLGKTYPLLDERVMRIDSALNDVYRREHEVSLASLESMSKRDARKYLESIEGVVPFVVARVTLFSLGAHALPVEDRLVRRLEEAGVLEPGSNPAKAAGSLERQVKADEAVGAYLKLQHFSEHGVGAGRTASTRKTTTAKKAAASKRTVTKKKASSSRVSKATKKTTKRKTTRKKSSG